MTIISIRHRTACCISHVQWWWNKTFKCLHCMKHSGSTKHTHMRIHYIGSFVHWCKDEILFVDQCAALPYYTCYTRNHFNCLPQLLDMVIYNHYTQLLEWYAVTTRWRSLAIIWQKSLLPIHYLHLKYSSTDIVTRIKAGLRNLCNMQTGWGPTRLPHNWVPGAVPWGKVAYIWT